MSYTRNFGFRDFSNIVRDGRNLTPATGNPLVLGTAVKVDASNPGQLVAVTSEVAPTALSGILVYEHIQFQGVDPFLTSPQDAPFDVAPLARYAQIVHGLGVKVWFKNTSSKPLYDGRTQTGRTMVAGLTATTPSAVVGAFLTPDTGGTWKVTATAGNAWMQIEYSNTTTGLVEARLTF